jgi:hypothetical protein
MEGVDVQNHVVNFSNSVDGRQAMALCSRIATAGEEGAADRVLFA